MPIFRWSCLQPHASIIAEGVACNPLLYSDSHHWSFFKRELCTASSEIGGCVGVVCNPSEMGVCTTPSRLELHWGCMKWGMHRDCKQLSLKSKVPLSESCACNPSEMELHRVAHNPLWKISWKGAAFEKRDWKGVTWGLHTAIKTIFTW